MKLFGKGGGGVTQDKRGLLVGGKGVPIWLAGVIKKGCEEVFQSNLSQPLSAHNGFKECGIGLAFILGVLPMRLSGVQRGDPGKYLRS